MRVLILFSLAATALAGDRFETDLQAFQTVSGMLAMPGAKARINPAIEKLVEGGDPRAVVVLARYLVDTIASEKEARVVLKKTQQRGADAHESMLVLDKEIGYMSRKLDAGDRSVAPEIQKRIEKKDKAQRTFEEVIAKSKSLDRVLRYHFELRDNLRAGLAKLLSGLKGNSATGSLAGLRTVLDVANEEHALYLVEILHRSGNPAILDHMIGVLDHPKAAPSVRVAAVVALTHIRRPKAYRALLAVAERDEAMRPQILHGLSMAATRPLADLKAAKAWIATQE